jgi:hypothetical protein
MSDIIIDKEEDLFKNPNVLNYLLSDWFITLRRNC